MTPFVDERKTMKVKFATLAFVANAFLHIAVLVESTDSKSKTQNTRPIIGILAQDTGLRSISKYGTSFIAASYVKLVESAGARVVPIFVNQTEWYYRKMFKSINGVVFPGGGSKVFSPDVAVGRSAAFMYSYAIESFKVGDYFPIYGICFGLELLAMLTDSFSCLATNLSATDISLPLNFKPGYESSRMFGRQTAPPEIIEILSSQNVTFNAHHKGVTLETFSTNYKLNTFYQSLSTNRDKLGVEFISSIEAYNYPIYGTQWHPEKNPFEWDTDKDGNIAHWEDAIKVAQFMANFFVSEARKNHHKFASEEEESAALIYQYQPIYTGEEYIIEQCYIFK